MEKDKENVRRTRTPLPQHPLRAVPMRLLANKTGHAENITLRRPLKTIHPQAFAMAGPSKPETVTRKPRVKIDTKHVTVRERCENSAWQVFEEHHDKDASIISISDDETGLEENDSVENKDRNNLGEPLTAVTPLKRRKERSLKRPHRGELQLGPCPAAEQDNIDEERIISENLEERLLAPDYWKVLYNRDYTKDVFRYLATIETKLAVPRTSGIKRASVINWLMAINGAEGNPATIQAACWYLDCMLVKGRVQMHKLKVVAAACYWLAEKLHGMAASALSMVELADRAFTVDDLVAAELEVLKGLEFPPQPVVPQDYIPYLALWSDKIDPGEIETAATFLCVSGLMVDKTLCDEYPSVIAAAAVRNAFLLLNKKDIMMHLESCPVYEKAFQKAVNFSNTCSILRRAVRTMSAPDYRLKAPLARYGAPPNNTAQKIMKAAKNCK